MEKPDRYHTLARPSTPILYKVKNSRFYGYAYPLISENEVRPLLDSLKTKHPAANHYCYAWRLGVNSTSYRVNDDGEPKNTAGMPIYGQIQSFKLTNVLVVVVRIFGGTKLGVGGLIGAYRNTAQMALMASKVVEKTILVQVVIKFGYADMDKVMRIIKQNKIKIVTQHFEMDCNVVVDIPKSQVTEIIGKFSALKNVAVLKKDN
ncbi:MAG: YigZ family protein [Maribacter sp.]|nr:YigZ family protein [Maribacter sp.]MBT8313764.1 YigZ family protein [Maribacter sp.]NNK19162.1 YigZ family protein [Maribacter sp.]